MNAEEVMAACEALPGVSWYYPFGEQPRCYRVGGKKIFAQVFPLGVEGALRILLADESIAREKVTPMVTLCCEPFQGDFYRQQYPATVLRPYHSPPAQQPYANTILLDHPIPDAVLSEMIFHAYNTALDKLPQKVQRQLRGNG